MSQRRSGYPNSICFCAGDHLPEYSDLGGFGWLRVVWLGYSKYTCRSTERVSLREPDAALLLCVHSPQSVITSVDAVISFQAKDKTSSYRAEQYNNVGSYNHEAGDGW